jgi:hypothetical protein
MTPHRGIGLTPARNLAQEALIVKPSSAVRPDSGLLALRSTRPA